MAAEEQAVDSVVAIDAYRALYFSADAFLDTQDLYMIDLQSFEESLVASDVYAAVRTDEDTACTRYKPPLERPARGSATADIARAYHQVCVFRRNARQVVGVVAEVAVHLHDLVGAHRKSLLEPCHVCAAKTFLAFAVKALNPRFGLHQILDGVSSSVGGIVVNEKKRGSRHGLQHGLGHRSHILALVVGRYDDYGLHARSLTLSGSRLRGVCRRGGRSPPRAPQRSCR